MIDTHRDRTRTAPDESIVRNVQKTGVDLVAHKEARGTFTGFSHFIRRYPLPSASASLLFVSLLLWLVGRADLANWVLFVIVLLGGIPLLWETVQQFMHRELSVDLIAILAIVGSLLLGQYLAGAIVVLMLSGGEALEAYALRRARSSLSALAERAPRTAHVWQKEQLIDIPAEEIDVGMEVVVKPGELVPVDGVVVKGSSSVSEADLTGEPMPVRKTSGMLVLSGSVNLDGVLEVRANKRSAESKYAQIVRLVQEAQEQKAPIHRLADRYSVGFTAAAVALAIAAWVLSGDSVYALAVLVVATPCPLILATPIAIMSGVDLAARHGIIIKSGAAIEQLGEVDVVVFDKTGTLTLGVPKVATLVQEQDRAVDEGGEALLRLAASVEQLSSHILASAVVEAAQEQELPLSPTTNFEEVFGKGVQGYVPLIPRDRLPLGINTTGGRERMSSGTGAGSVCRSGADRASGVGKWSRQSVAGWGEQVHVAVGNRTFMRQLGIVIPSSLLAARERCVTLGQMGSFIAVDGQGVGLIVLQDIPREDISQLAPNLKKVGIKEIVLLTGDTEVVAQQVGELAQVDRVVARCLPEDKVYVIQALLGQGHRVLMVGDGVNDAPALATATVGMALGSQGLTAAATAADAVLLSTDIHRVVTAVRLGRHVMRVALQGIWIGMGLSVIAMLFASFGFIPPAVGAILQEGIDVIVILNALRAGRIVDLPLADTQSQSQGTHAS